MKIFFLFFAFALSSSLWANEFDDEFLLLERENAKIESSDFKTDEVQLSNSAIKKEEGLDERPTTEISTEDLFLKTKEVKARRIRSR
jgi:hypothetical protein